MDDAFGRHAILCMPARRQALLLLAAILTAAPEASPAEPPAAPAAKASAAAAKAAKPTVSKPEDTKTKVTKKTATTTKVTTSKTTPEATTTKTTPPATTTESTTTRSETTERTVACEPWPEHPILKETTEDVSDSHVVRLYHHRNASVVAKALDQAVNCVGVKAIGADVLVLRGGPPTKEWDIQEVRRYIALIDLPRPEFALTVWGYQVSEEPRDFWDKAKWLGAQAMWDYIKGRPADAAERFEAFRGGVAELDRGLRLAVASGWKQASDTLSNSSSDRPQASDESESARARLFRNYLTGRHGECEGGRQYCLGYSEAFLRGPATLSGMLLFLAGADWTAADAKSHGDAVVESMNAQLRKAWNEARKHLKTSKTFEWGEESVPLAQEGERKASLDRFQMALEELYDEHRRDVLRAALLDFLLHYKWSVTYPHHFVPYDLGQSAARLDSILVPVVEALNADFEEFVLMAIDPFLNEKTAAGIKFKSFGYLTVEAISGTPARVSAGSANYFDVSTPDPLMSVLSGPAGGLPTLSEVAAPEVVAAFRLLAAAEQEPKLAEVKRGLQLEVTPEAMATAASAELKIKFSVGDDDADPVLLQGAKTKAPIDRVAAHSVEDIVRVENVRLFELSTFRSEIMLLRPDAVFPVVGHVWRAIFGRVPIVGDLFSIPRDPAESKHRSIALVTALIVPTAADLALGIRFDGDRVAAENTRGERPLVTRPHRSWRQQHKKIVRCLRALGPYPRNGRCEGLFASDSKGASGAPSVTP